MENCFFPETIIRPGNITKKKTNNRLPNCSVALTGTAADGKNIDMAGPTNKTVPMINSSMNKTKTEIPGGNKSTRLPVLMLSVSALSSLSVILFISRYKTLRQYR
jgi:hypothetical protein